MTSPVTVLLFVGSVAKISKTTFSPRPRRGPSKFSEMAIWMADSKTFDVPCHPRTQHATFCRVSRTAANKLRVRIYRMKHSDPKTGHLFKDHLAARCK